MAKMNQEVKKEWVADLRSGAIHKQLGQLRRGNRMCALGVLCNVHAKHHPEIAAKQTKKSEYMGHNVSLPAEVKKWAGLDSYDPHLNMVDPSSDRIINRRLSILNDAHHVSFKKMADLIEEQL